MTILKSKKLFVFAGGAALALVVMVSPAFVSASHNEDSSSLTGQKTVRTEGSSTDRAFQGWPIRLYDEDGDLLDTDTTDARGEYAFTGLEAGTYRVCEGSGSDFPQTFPRTSASTSGDPDVEVVLCPGGTAGYEVELDANEEKDDLDFRNEERVTSELVTACAAGPAITVTVGTRVTFGAATNRLSPALFEWSSDVSGMGQSITTVFTTPGTRTATITATDGDDRARSTCAVTVIAAAMPTPGGVGGAPGETPVGQAPVVTPPAETDTGEETTDETTPATDEEASDGEETEGASAARDNLWWIVLAVIVIALAGYYLWERQRGAGVGPGKPEKKEGGTPPPPAPPQS